MNPFLGSYIIESEHQSCVGFFWFFLMSVFILIYVCSLKCFLGFFGVCACFVNLDCVPLSTPATYGREGNGLRAGHVGRKYPETNFPCVIIQATTGIGDHTYFKI